MMKSGKMPKDFACIRIQQFSITCTTVFMFFNGKGCSSIEQRWVSQTAAAQNSGE
jgi:hypothetical protein